MRRRLQFHAFDILTVFLFCFFFPPVCLLLAVLVGAIGGGLWLAVWQRFNFPTGQVFLMGLCSGYLIAAVIFFTPFGKFVYFFSLNKCF